VPVVEPPQQPQQTVDNDRPDFLTAANQPQTQPLPVVQQQQVEEKPTSTIVEGNAGQNVGWTHQQPQQQDDEVVISADSSNMGQQQQQQPIDPSNESNGGVASESEDRFLTGPPDFSKQQVQQQQAEDSKQEVEDRWPTGPPDFSKQQVQQQPEEDQKPQPNMDLARPVDTPVNFPAVKFPMTSTDETPAVPASKEQNDQQDKPEVADSPPGIAPPQEADTPSPPVVKLQSPPVGNPVFFQVDDPIDPQQQPQQLTAPIRTVAAV